LPILWFGKPEGRTLAAEKWIAQHGIPVVVGALGATQRIQISHCILVDGNRGYVGILGDD